MSALRRLWSRMRRGRPARTVADIPPADSPPPGYAPAIWRGATAFDLGNRTAGIGFATYDGDWHQFLLFDRDLVRMGQAIAEMFPRVAFVPSGQGHPYQRGMKRQCEISRGRRQSAGLIPDDVRLQSPDSSFPKTSAGS